MDYSIRCECGHEMRVSEGSAGARIPCNCGRIVEIPSLGALRTSRGLPAVDVPLEIEVLSKLESGELPPSTCIGCGKGADRIWYVAECEQIHERTSRDKWPLFQGIAFAIGLFANLLVFTYRVNGRDETVTTMHGREINIPVPVRCCESCRDTLIREPTNGVLKTFGTLLVWAGMVGLMLFYYVIGVASLLVGISLQWVVSSRQVQYQRRLRDLLSNIPFYKRVFDKYPDAVIEVH